MLSLILGEEKVYFSSNSTCRESFQINTLDNICTFEVLNSISISRLSYHKITLKIGVSIMLLRNIDQSFGLCNGIYLIVIELEDHVIGVTILSGIHFGKKIFIPGMNMSHLNSKWPFRFQRKQYPLIISYTMIIIKSQRQIIFFCRIIS